MARSRGTSILNERPLPPLPSLCDDEHEPSTQAPINEQHRHAGRHHHSQDDTVYSHASRRSQSPYSASPISQNVHKRSRDRQYHAQFRPSDTRTPFPSPTALLKKKNRNADGETGNDEKDLVPSLLKRLKTSVSSALSSAHAHAHFPPTPPHSPENAFSVSTLPDEHAMSEYPNDRVKDERGLRVYEQDQSREFYNPHQHHHFQQYTYQDGYAFPSFGLSQELDTPPITPVVNTTSLPYREDNRQQDFYDSHFPSDGTVFNDGELEAPSELDVHFPSDEAIYAKRGESRFAFFMDGMSENGEVCEVESVNDPEWIDGELYQGIEQVDDASGEIADDERDEILDELEERRRLKLPTLPKWLGRKKLDKGKGSMSLEVMYMFSIAN